MNCRLKAAGLPRCKDVGSKASSQPGGPRGPADDGKRFNEVRVRWELYSVRSQKNIFRKGRGLGRGGPIIDHYSRLADDGKRLGLSESALDVASSIVKNFTKISS